jgi:signal transduction histidine kinase
MTEALSPNEPGVQRHHWRGAAICAILALLLVAALVTVRDSVRASNEMRVRASMQRNEAIAALAAAFLKDAKDSAPALTIPTLPDGALDDGSKLVIVDAAGRGLPGAELAELAYERLGPELVEHSRTKPRGWFIQFGHAGTPRMLVGYAAIGNTGRIAAVLIPSETALAPERYMIRRITYVLVPGVLLVIGAAWVLASYTYKQRKLTWQLAEHNARLREADQAKSDFLANVSHDLRTPLAGLRLALSGMLDPEVEWGDNDVRDFLQVASEQVDQLGARVRNLLDMARIESSSQPVHKETCDLTDIVSSVIERMAPLLRGRKVISSFPPEPLFVDCDQVQVATVILNLLENGVKYSPEGSPLYIKGELTRPCVTFSVSDSGPGVSPEDREYIFAKFYRSPSVASIGGTGLGLAICQSIVREHGGKIGVRQSARGGSEFWFTLPLPLIDIAAPSPKWVAK